MNKHIFNIILIAFFLSINLVIGQREDTLWIKPIFIDSIKFVSHYHDGEIVKDYEILCELRDTLEPIFCQKYQVIPVTSEQIPISLFLHNDWIKVVLSVQNRTKPRLDLGTRVNLCNSVVIDCLRLRDEIDITLLEVLPDKLPQVIPVRPIIQNSPPDNAFKWFWKKRKSK